MYCHFAVLPTIPLRYGTVRSHFPIRSCIVNRNGIRRDFGTTVLVNAGDTGWLGQDGPVCDCKERQQPCGSQACWSTRPLRQEHAGEQRVGQALIKVKGWGLNRVSVCEEGCRPAQAGVYTVLMSRTFFCFCFIFARSSSFALTISTMASSDDWIKSFDSMTIIPSPLLSQSQSSPGGSTLSGGTISGEYGGGGAKRATLFYYVDSLAALCLGFVRLGRKRFCLKPKADGASSCGVAKHSIKFSPSPGSYYLRGGGFYRLLRT